MLLFLFSLRMKLRVVFLACHMLSTWVLLFKSANSFDVALLPFTSFPIEVAIAVMSFVFLIGVVIFVMFSFVCCSSFCNFSQVSGISLSHNFARLFWFIWPRWEVDSLFVCSQKKPSTRPARLPGYMSILKNLCTLWWVIGEPENCYILMYVHMYIIEHFSSFPGT